MRKTAIIHDLKNHKEYVRLISYAGVAIWRDITSVGDVTVHASKSIELEQQYLTSVLYKKAAEHAGLKYPFDRDDEMYYQTFRVKVYDAYIAGHIAAGDELINIPTISI